MNFTTDNFDSWERFYRANFINSLTGYKSASLIGTINLKGVPNLAIFSSIVHLGANPALIGFINRPIQSSPHTLANIEATGAYTINHIHVSFIEKAHQTSARYDDNINEFEAVGLTPEYFDHSKVPFVKESIIKYSMTLEEIVPIKLNNTFLVIGKVKSVSLDPALISEDGFIHIEKANSIASNGLDAYYAPNLINRYQYAKPGIKPTILDK